MPFTTHKQRWFYPGDAPGYLIALCRLRVGDSKDRGDGDLRPRWSAVTCPACYALMSSATRSNRKRAGEMSGEGRA